MSPVGFGFSQLTIRRLLHYPRNANHNVLRPAQVINFLRFRSAPIGIVSDKGCLHQLSALDIRPYSSSRSVYRNIK